jgi:hypothetical protein
MLSHIVHVCAFYIHQTYGVLTSKLCMVFYCLIIIIIFCYCIELLNGSERLSVELWD